MAARLRELYNNTIVGELKTKFDRENILSLPRLQKIVINMGVGSAVNDKKELIDANEAMTLICLLYTSPSPRDQRGSRMPSSA